MQTPYLVFLCNNIFSRSVTVNIDFNLSFFYGDCKNFYSIGSDWEGMGDAGPSPLSDPYAMNAFQVCCSASLHDPEIAG